MVLTLWDWGVETSFIHDEIATAKNNPHLNAYGPVYGASAGHGKVSVVDPIKNRAYEITIPTRDDPKTIPSRFPRPAVSSSFLRYDTSLVEPAREPGRSAQSDDRQQRPAVADLHDPRPGESGLVPRRVG